MDEFDPTKFGATPVNSQSQPVGVQPTQDFDPTAHGATISTTQDKSAQGESQVRQLHGAVNIPYVSPTRDANYEGENALLHPIQFGMDVGRGFASDPVGVLKEGAEGGLKALANVPSSMYNIGKGIYQIGRHPIETAKGALNLAYGGGQSIARQALEKTGLAERVNALPLSQQEQLLHHFTDTLSKKYGSMEALGEHATNNPSQFGLDVVTALKAASAVADKVKNVSGNLNVAKQGFTPGHDVSGTMNTYDDLVRSGDAPVASVYKDVATKTFQPEVAAKVVSDAQGFLKQQGFASVADKFGKAVDVNNLNPQSVLSTAQGLLAQEGATFSNALNTGLSTIAQSVIKPVSAGLHGLANLASGTLGITTGTGPKSAQKALDVATSGKESRQAFTEGMRNKTTPDQVIDEAKSGLESMQGKKNTAYTEQLRNVKADTSSYDVSPVQKGTDDLLKNYNIKTNGKGVLDFKDSKFALDTTAQNDIQKIYDYVKNLGTRTGSRTPEGLDIAKKVISGEYSPNSDFRALTQGIKNLIWNPKEKSGVLSNVEGYSKLTGDYETASTLIKDLKSSLSMGGRAGIETTFNKLMQGIKGNSALKETFLNQLNQETGGTLIPKMVGAKFNPMIPGGLTGMLEGIGGIGALSAPGGLGISHILPMLTIASPRMVGEFFNVLGLSKEASSAVMNAINVPAQAGLYGSAVTNNLNPRQSERK